MPLYYCNNSDFGGNGGPFEAASKNKFVEEMDECLRDWAQYSYESDNNEAAFDEILQDLREALYDSLEEVFEKND